MRLRVTLVLALLIASFYAVPVLARTSVPLPFKAHATGFAGPPPTGPPPWPMDVIGSGIATHMGRVTVSQTHIVAPNAIDPAVLDFYDGTFVWTAANGDQLFGTYSGYLTMNVATGYYEIHGQFVITGGTGKFQSATGGGLASGTQSPIDGAFDFTLDGTIVFS